MHGYFSYKSMDEEKRKLRLQLDTYKRAWEFQKQKTTTIQEENTTLKKENEKLREQEEKLREELEKVKRERDTYKGMLFKPNKQLLVSGLAEQPSGRKRGGQRGHIGYGRKNPEHSDRYRRTYLSYCPECTLPLKRTQAVRTHTVTDIPQWTEQEAVVTAYEIERQWCRHCKKEVNAVPRNVLPQSKLGTTLLTMICVWKYRFRLPVGKITELLKTMYGLSISQGAIMHTLSRARKYLSPQYEAFLTEIRGSPVKHADETGWRIAGRNAWCWAFVTPKETLYTIEESRGKGVPEKKLSGATGVLVRDDYGAYEKLPLVQQSCWAHLLRKSHEASVQENASEEVQYLHKALKDLFGLLAEDLSRPFDKVQRQELHGWYREDLLKIIQKTYSSADTKRIQTRITNQYTNLLTALLYKDVPLTNNTAERAIRPFVITRKISGGSQTQRGAEIHAVNMSIIETIAKRKQPLLQTLQDYLLQGAAVKN